MRDVVKDNVSDKFTAPDESENGKRVVDFYVEGNTHFKHKNILSILE